MRFDLLHSSSKKSSWAWLIFASAAFLTNPRHILVLWKDFAIVSTLLLAKRLLAQKMLSVLLRALLILPGLHQSVLSDKSLLAESVAQVEGEASRTSNGICYALHFRPTRCWSARTRLKNIVQAFHGKKLCCAVTARSCVTCPVLLMPSFSLCPG